MRGKATTAAVVAIVAMAGLTAMAQEGGGRDDPAIGRGAAVAQAKCASCHAIALEDHSPERDAPQFRVLSRLYSAQNLAEKLFDFAEAGHFEMPPVALREDEIADVSAYIASLDGGSIETPPRRGRPTSNDAAP